MKRDRFAPNEYFHIFNRGVDKRLIFHNDWDRARFLTFILLAQGDSATLNFTEISKYTLRQCRHPMSALEVAKVLNIREKSLEKILNARIVELIEFCLMPNHFHLLLKESQEGGISKYMQRLGNSFTKYFNVKYERRGHLFESTFNAIHIDKNDYLLPLSVYIHINPYKLKDWKNKEDKYPWSSFQDFLGSNRWGKLLNPSIVLEQFNNGNDYKRFVDEYEPREELDQKYLIDMD